MSEPPRKRARGSWKRRRFPATQFMRRYMPSGNAENIAHYGRTWKEATPEQQQLRKEHFVYGTGAYSVGKNWRKFSQGIGLTGVGRRLLGAGAGLAASTIAGSGMYTGHGAYGNSLMQGGEMADEVPQVSSTADETGTVCVSRREYIADIYGPSAAFNVQSYALNPGLEGTFPWLSQIAQNYDEYQFDQLIFHYRSTTTDIGSSTTGQCGTVIMTTNYNAAAPAFGDKAVMMEYDGAMSCKTTESMTHGVECDVLKRAGADSLYIRSNPVIVGQDPKSYDHGTFQLAVANSPAAYANQAIGELWVSYTVRLSKPKFFTARGLGISRDLFVSGAGTETTTAIMGTPAGLLYGQQNNLGCLLDFPAASQIRLTFPASYAGTVEVTIMTEGFTAAAGASPFSGTIVYGGNVSAVFDMYASGGSAVDDAPRGLAAAHTNSGWTSGASQTQAIYVLHLRVSPATGGVNNTVIMTTGTLLTAPTQSQLTVSEYNAGFSSRALGIGPSGAQSDAPILVNSSGVVVVPG